MDKVPEFSFHVSNRTPPTKEAGTFRRAVRWSELTMIPVKRPMEYASLQKLTIVQAIPSFWSQTRFL